MNWKLELENNVTGCLLCLSRGFQGQVVLISLQGFHQKHTHTSWFYGRTSEREGQQYRDFKGIKSIDLCLKHKSESPVKKREEYNMISPFE